MNKKHILFVDDEIKTLNGFRRMLRNYVDDWNMKFVTSVDEALIEIDVNGYDLVLSDMKMPSKTGLDLLRELNDSNKIAMLPVIILTGLNEAELKRQALELGAVDLLNKPVQIEDLLARIKNALKLKEYQDELLDRTHVLEEQLMQKQKMEVIGSLAAGAFHDMNNILAIIGGYSQLAQMNPKLINKSLAQINESSKIASQLIQQILEFSRAKTGTKEICDLGQIISESLELMRHCLPKRIELCWTPTNGLTPIAVNRIQMFQLIMNLCLNASHAIKDLGTIEISLTEFDVVDCEQKAGGKILNKGKYIILAVCDSGSGMGEQTLDNLFKPFFSKKWDDGGTGLGLAVVNRIIDLHHGIIDVASAQGDGTDIRVYLPI